MLQLAAEGSRYLLYGLAGFALLMLLAHMPPDLRRLFSKIDRLSGRISLLVATFGIVYDLANGGSYQDAITLGLMAVILLACEYLDRTRPKAAQNEPDEDDDDGPDDDDDTWRRVRLRVRVPSRS